MSDTVKEPILTEDINDTAEESSVQEDYVSDICAENEPMAAPEESEDASNTVDRDLIELREEFPELSEIESITELSNPIRYAALRDLGLSPAEAYILTSRKRSIYDNRSHLTTSIPATAKSPRSGLSSRELEAMRNIFEDMSDSEIHKLYKKVSK